MVSRTPTLYGGGIRKGGASIVFGNVAAGRLDLLCYRKGKKWQKVENVGEEVGGVQETG